MKKIVVPEGMLKAARECWISMGVKPPQDKNIQVVLEAALRWLSENPIVPTEDQYQSIHNEWCGRGEKPAAQIIPAVDFPPEPEDDNSDIPF